LIDKRVATRQTQIWYGYTPWRKTLSKLKEQQLFVSPNDKPFAVIAMCVSHEDRSPFAMHGCNTAPTPTRFAKIVRDDFPVLHVDSILRFSSVQSGHMVSLGKLRADFPELAPWTISNASSNEYRPASARRFVYP
jgi:hypothetical protein